MVYIDTRDLVDRLEELNGIKEQMDSLSSDIRSLNSDLDDTEEGEDYDNLQSEISDLESQVDDLIDEYDEDEHNELSDLKREISEFYSGATLIPEDEFVDYVEDMLKDCGDLPRDIPWYVEIDWEKTADNIRSDYSEVTYQGETYLVSN